MPQPRLPHSPGFTSQILCPASASNASKACCQRAYCGSAVPFRMMNVSGTAPKGSRPSGAYSAHMDSQMPRFVHSRPLFSKWLWARNGAKTAGTSSVLLLLPVPFRERGALNLILVSEFKITAPAGSPEAMASRKAPLRYCVHRKSMAGSVPVGFNSTQWSWYEAPLVTLPGSPDAGAQPGRTRSICRIKPELLPNCTTYRLVLRGVRAPGAPLVFPAWTPAADLRGPAATSAGSVCGVSARSLLCLAGCSADKLADRLAGWLADRLPVWLADWSATRLLAWLDGRLSGRLVGSAVDWASCAMLGSRLAAKTLDATAVQAFLTAAAAEPATSAAGSAGAVPARGLDGEASRE
mmetsp:Transcript_52823/g.92224  ORF Transcript_52823/g.92224 Transcript_52823/m.92224 type:complete len:352 (+) Transcript_52823:881-1936(+)